MRKATAAPHGDPRTCHSRKHDLGAGGGDSVAQCLRMSVPLAFTQRIPSLRAKLCNPAGRQHRPDALALPLSPAQAHPLAEVSPVPRTGREVHPAQDQSLLPESEPGRPSLAQLLSQGLRHKESAVFKVPACPPVFCHRRFGDTRFRGRTVPLDSTASPAGRVFPRTLCRHSWGRGHGPKGCPWSRATIGETKLSTASVPFC